MYKFFWNLYLFFSKHKLVFWLFILLISIFIGYFATQIKLEEDISNFLPNDPKVAKINYVFKNINISDKLIVNISLKDSTIESNPDALIEFADLFVDSLSKTFGKEFVKEINYKLSDDLFMEMYKHFYQNLPLYLDSLDYTKISESLSEDKIRQIMADNKNMLLSPASMILKSSVASDPLHFTAIPLMKLKQLQINDNYQVYNNCIFSKDLKHLLIFITSANPTNETSKNGLLVNGVNNLLTACNVKLNNNYFVEYFGAIAVGVGNASQIKKDSLYTSLIALVAIVILLSFYFKKKSVIFYLMLPVIFGVGVALAAMYLIKHQISAIALGAGSAIFGIAINYSLHVFAHFRHKNSVREVIKDLTVPLIIGSTTTIGAFLSLLFVKSEALHDFGLFSALSLAGTILFSLIVVPHLLKEDKKAINLHSDTFLERISSYKLENNKFVVLAIIVLTILFYFTSANVEFESDMAKINYMTNDLKKAESNLRKITDIGQKSIYLIATGKDLNSAIKNLELSVPDLQTLQKNNAILSYSNPSFFILSDSAQNKKINQWNSFWTLQKKEELTKMISKIGLEFKFKETAFNEFYALLYKDFKPIQQSEFNILSKSLLKEYITENDSLCMVVSSIKLNQNNISLVEKQFSSNHNIIVFDKKIIASKFVEIISSDFNLVLISCSILVLFFLIVSYGRIELGLITFAPMLISWIWILGIMGLFGIKFNIINIIISTFIFGLGDDYSIFIMDGMLQERNTGRKYVTSYKSAVSLSAITMFIGIGVLVFAKHPAMQSLAIVTIIGMISTVIISYSISPILFKWLMTIKGRRRIAPMTFRNLTKSIISFSVFFVGSILLTIFGWVVLSNIKPTPKRKLLFHKMLMYISKFVVYVLIGVKKKVINISGENFEKPAIIICNHQSHIDLVLMMMLTPKMIIITNDWVWNSPFYGKIVKFADFYPASSGIENKVDILAAKMNEGYSILIFPEGTRSADMKINRFHRGAFFLAETLNADILPIMIHGVGDCVTKGELVLKSGSMTVKILPRIKLQDKEYGASFGERAKFIRKMYINEHDAMRAEYEDGKYLRHQLFYNYLYKGMVLQNYIKFNLKAENYYQKLLDLIPRNASITDLGCGYGDLAMLLSFHSQYRFINAIDSDSDKIDIASNCVGKSDNLNFICSDVFQNEIPKADIILCMDFISLFPLNEQMNLLNRAYNSLNDKGIIIVSDKNPNFIFKLMKSILGLNVAEIQNSHFDAINSFCIENNIILEKELDSKYGRIFFIIRKQPKSYS